MDTLDNKLDISEKRFKTKWNYVGEYLVPGYSTYRGIKTNTKYPVNASWDKAKCVFWASIGTLASYFI